MLLRLGPTFQRAPPRNPVCRAPFLCRAVPILPPLSPSFTSPTLSPPAEPRPRNPRDALIASLLTGVGLLHCARLATDLHRNSLLRAVCLTTLSRQSGTTPLN
ncbi:hypothetical protein MRX96_003075 [Rhipicephalus microplus]